MTINPNHLKFLCLVLLGFFILSGCASKVPNAPMKVEQMEALVDNDYLIGPGDSLNIFVWRNADVSTTVTVRPDGKFSIPLIEDMVAVGKAPTQLAREIEQGLSTYLKNPKVTVIVTGFIGPFGQQIRIVGEATAPQSLPYRNNMTLLDIMIAVGGLTDAAAGNDARIVRTINGQQKEYRVFIEDLLKDGDISANVEMLPGDILVIPQSWF